MERQQVTVEKVTKELLSNSSHLKGVEAIGIFGSLARGDFNERSDIDVYVVLEKDMEEVDQDRYWYRRIKELLGKYWWKDVTILVYTIPSLKAVCTWYVLELASDSILVYDRGRVKQLFEKIIKKAKEAGLVRKVYQGRPIWGIGRPLKFGEIIHVEVEDDE